MSHSRPAALVLWLLVVFATAAFAGPAAGQSNGQDPRQEREDVRSRRAEAATAVDALQADEATVTSALADLDANLRIQRAAYGDAERAFDQAAEQVGRLEAAIADTEAEIDTLHEELRKFAVDSYVRPPSDQGFAILDAQNAIDGVLKDVFLVDHSSRSRDVVEELQAAEAALERQHDDAAEARREADEHRRTLDDRIGELEEARMRQESFASQVEDRLNAKLIEADQLTSLDKSLSDEITRQEAALAAALRRSRPSPSSSPSAAAGGGSGGGGGGGPVVAVPLPGDLVSVRGIVVHASIAGRLEGLLNAANAAGVSLSGSGYRDVNLQIELRRQNCGSSEYAVWQMSPDACSPPTAIPGRSMHERGLAIDFTFNGQIIRSRGSEAFQWMAANAPGFGFTNLPSEPWHWSVNGQ